jgi:hypothetical protein
MGRFDGNLEKRMALCVMGRAKPATRGRVRFAYTNPNLSHSFFHKYRQLKGERHLWKNECLIVEERRTRPSLAGFNAPRDIFGNIGRPKTKKTGCKADSSRTDGADAKEMVTMSASSDN